MRSETARQILAETPIEVREKVMTYSVLEKVIDEAYELYMPQDRYEITELAKYVQSKYKTSLHEPYNVLEVGTKFGGTFYIWNSINAVNSKSTQGNNISIDMSDGGIHGGISDEEMDKRDLWFKERFSNCHFIRGNSHDRETYRKLVDFKYSQPALINYHYTVNPWIDFLFIDGDHTYEGVKQDFQMYSPLVKKGGLIAFHDINDTELHRSRNVYVAKLWYELKDDPRFEAIEFNSHLNWAGIGVLLVK